MTFSHSGARKETPSLPAVPAPADDDLFDAAGVTREGFAWAREQEREALSQTTYAIGSHGAWALDRCWLTLKGLQAIDPQRAEPQAES